MIDPNIADWLMTLGLSEGAVAGLAAAVLLFWLGYRWWAEAQKLRVVSTDSYVKQLAALETSLEHERRTRRADIEAERSARREDVARLEAHIRTLKADLVLKKDEVTALQERLHFSEALTERQSEVLVQWADWGQHARTVVSSLTDRLEMQGGDLDRLPALSPLPIKLEEPSHVD